MIQFNLHSKHSKGKVILEKGKYGNKRTALSLIDPRDGDTVMVATVNVPDVHLEKNEVIIKDYSENEGVLDCLIQNKIVSPPKKFVQTGFVSCPVVDLLV